MRTEPLFQVTAFDVHDDPECGCESCMTPWGTGIPFAFERSTTPKEKDEEGDEIGTLITIQAQQPEHAG